MKAILLFLLFFQVSMYAQTNSENLFRKKLYFTTINGKNDINDKGGAIKMTRNEIIDASITLKGKEENEKIPPIIELEIYIPGYPAILIEGSQIDRETAIKIMKTKAGNVVVIKPRTEIASNITTRQIEIIE
ncbi:hypothetical protein ACX0HA_13960 [Flavobacterium hauense]